MTTKAILIFTNWATAFVLLLGMANCMNIWLALVLIWFAVATYLLIRADKKGEMKRFIDKITK